MKRVIDVEKRLQSWGEDLIRRRAIKRERWDNKSIPSFGCGPKEAKEFWDNEAEIEWDKVRIKELLWVIEMKHSDFFRKRKP